MDAADGRRVLRAEWPGGEPVVPDQRKGVPHPPVEKPYPADAELIDLVPPGRLRVGTMPLIDAIRRRRSRREFTDAALTLEELSFLLWATQGVREVTPDGIATKRSVPSGGARHPFETYLSVHRVEGLDEGLYRYLAVEHKLCVLSRGSGCAERACEACRNQESVRQSAVTFVWAAIPYRTEWRYPLVSQKLIALDAGHVCQNLYLAAESIGCGTCAIAAYHQKKLDALLSLDGEDEFAVYAAPVGKIA